MRTLLITLIATVAVAAAALPAAVGADAAAAAAPIPADTALRPTAVEYAVMPAAEPAGPRSKPATERGVLDADPGFGGGGTDPVILLGASSTSRGIAGDLRGETGYYSPAGNMNTWPLGPALF
jgi:hypothetical protein